MSVWKSWPAGPVARAPHPRRSVVSAPSDGGIRGDGTALGEYEPLLAERGDVGKRVAVDDEEVGGAAGRELTDAVQAERAGCVVVAMSMTRSGGQPSASV